MDRAHRAQCSFPDAGTVRSHAEVRSSTVLSWALGSVAVLPVASAEASGYHAGSAVPELRSAVLWEKNEFNPSIAVDNHGFIETHLHLHCFTFVPTHSRFRVHIRSGRRGPRVRDRLKSGW